MPLDGEVERAYQRTYGSTRARDKKSTGKLLYRPRNLRSAANAEKICDLIAQGLSVDEVARRFGCSGWAILKWVREDDEKTNGEVIGRRYAKAREIGYELLADSLLSVAERSCVGPDGRVDPGAVQQARLEVDTRKWMLAKMLPKVYGDKLEVSGNADAPVLTRIELVAVHPKPREPLTIEHSVEQQSSEMRTADVAATRARGEVTNE